ncbi:hypothetical protein [Romboutsia lituseburensis]|uniref:hypothetical protein n=1 Tax=Romboutsia lituseburensis TaxID=1537 RepID=UPI0022EAA826|nr:hypothetical protein [Romboutsia lituseburensis]
MKTYKIWNKKEEIIEGVASDYIIKSHQIRENDEVFLVMDEYGNINQIEIVRIIKSVYGFDSNLTAEETAQAYLDLKAKEEENLIKEQITLEDQSKKIDILNAQSANLLLDNAKKEIEISTLNTNLANVTLEVAKIKGGM